MADTDSGAGTKARKWQTKSLAHFPILLVLSLLVSVIAVCAAVALLVIADGSPIDSWPVAPAVILSILVTISNTMLRYAFSEGSEFYWWSKLLSPSGVRLADLHTTWEISHSALSLLRFPARRARQYHLRLSTLLVLLLVITGPLLQRAVTIETFTRVEILNTTLPVRRQPMWNLTSKPIDINGVWGSLPPYQPEVMELASELNLRQPMTLSSPVCQRNATCTANVTIAGFGWECFDKEADPWNITSLPVAKTVIATDFTKAAIDFTERRMNSYPCEETGFHAKSFSSKLPGIPNSSFTDPSCGYFVSDAQIDFTRVSDAEEVPNGQLPTFSYATYLRKSLSTQKLAVRLCNFTTSFVELPIRIVDEKIVTIERSKHGSGSSPRKSRHDVERIPSGWNYLETASLINAFGQIMADMFSGYIMYDIRYAASLSMGASMRQYINQSSISLRQSNDYHSLLPSYGYGFTMLEPFDDFVATLDEVCLRYALKSIEQSDERLNEFISYLRGDFAEVDPGDVRGIVQGNMSTSFSEEQHVRMEESLALAVYKSTYIYLAAAAGIIYLAVLSTLLLLRPVFSSHGRTFSLSPLEVAKAFNAPLLTGVGSNFQADDIAESLTDIRVRYGEAVGDTKPSREVVNEHGWSSLTLDASTGVSDDSRMLGRDEALRLRIDLADCVSKPVRGRYYY